MVVAEVMLTVVLLAGAGLMMRSFLTLYQLDLGVDGDRILTARLQLVNQKYPESEQRVTFIDALTERLQAMPRVSAASVASNLPPGERRPTHTRDRRAPRRGRHTAAGGRGSRGRRRLPGLDRARHRARTWPHPS